MHFLVVGNSPDKSNIYNILVVIKFEYCLIIASILCDKCFTRINKLLYCIAMYLINTGEYHILVILENNVSSFMYQY